MKAGDHILVNGARAELLTDDPALAPTAVVRWLNPTPDGKGWWGYHHSRVPWDAITPVQELNTPTEEGVTP